MNIKTLVLLAAITSFGPLSMDLYLPGLPDLQADLSASESAAHLTVTSCIVGLAFGQLLSGMVPDRLGRRNPLLLGILLWIVATVLCALAPGVWVVAAFRVAQGVGAGVAIALARTVIADLDAENLATHLSRMMLVLAAVPVLAPAIGGVALSVTNWRGLFLALAVVGVVLLAVVFAKLPESRPVRLEPDVGGSALRRSIGLARTQRFIVPALASGAGFGVMFSYIGASAFVFRQGFGLSPAHYGVLFGVNAVSMITGFQIGPRLKSRWGARRVISAVAPLGAAAGLAMAISGTVAPTSLAPIVIALMVVLGSAGVIVPLATATAIEAFRAEAAAASGITGALQFLMGGVIGTLPDLIPADGAVALAVVCAGCLAVAAAVAAGTRGFDAPVHAVQPVMGELGIRAAGAS